MDILADTNLLIRRINRFDLQHKIERGALEALDRRGDRVCIVPQNIIECWSVATRPIERNGLGLLPTHAERICARIESAFHMLPERAEIYAEWRRLAAVHSVSGPKV